MKFSIENNINNSKEGNKEKISNIEKLRDERLGIAKNFLESMKDKSMTAISFIKDLPENTQKMIAGELQISTKSSIAQDSIPVWDLIKMSIENFQGKTWDGHELDRKSYMLRWTTIALRSMSLTTKVLMAMDIIEKDAGATLSDATLMMTFKTLGMGTYVADQLRHNYDSIKEKFIKTSTFIETKEVLSKWLELQKSTGIDDTKKTV